jgi:signal transduction histidine kinase
MPLTPPSASAFPALAARLTRRREAILGAWRSAVENDSSLTSGSSLPRAQLVDHIPALLEGFESQLREPGGDVFHVGDAAAHGLHRWQQGFGLAEVSRELGHLNECVVKELDSYGLEDPAPPRDALAAARSLWAGIFSVAVSASTAQYFKLQQIEAASHVGELESAFNDLHDLERQRALLWEQAAHDLRGNLGVVANATAGLSFAQLDAQARENFLRMLERNVQALHRLLDDVTSLARLQGGQEPRRVQELDVAALLMDMGKDLRVLAEAQGLSFELMGEPHFRAQSDPVKLQRIVQNLVLNAIRYTPQGRVKVSWGAAGPTDPQRWALQIEDSGPGLGSTTVSNLQDALETATGNAREATQANRVHEVVHVQPDDAGLSEAIADDGGTPAQGHGEGIGLSIVKRLCELLDATMQVDSGRSGTRFRILLPKRYPSDAPSP